MSEQKTLHLEFVLLTKDQHVKLCKLLTPEGAAHWIEELDDYLGLSEKNRRKYDSHYHAIRRWARLEAKKTGAGTGTQASSEKCARAADRFLADLKECNSWPNMTEEIRAIVYAVLRKQQKTWPALKKALLDDPTIADQLRSEFLTEAQKLRSP